MTRFARLGRLPPYVFATVNQIKMEARHQGKDIIDMGMGNPDLGTPPHIVAKLIEAGQKSNNHRYSASMGITKLRGAISNWYKRRFDVDVNPDTETIVTIGVYVWGKIPDKYVKLGSVEFAKFMIHHAHVAVSPGLGFGEYGDEYVRFALIENNMRINQAVRGIKNIL